MDADYGLPEKAGVIFCRNVIIYFDRPTQVRLLEKLTRHLAPGGYFFAGHSESLHEMDLPLVPVAPRSTGGCDEPAPEISAGSVSATGELYLARSPAILRTMLGSCVGVTFWSPRLGAGALCHGVLPRCPRGWSPVGSRSRATAMWTSAFATWRGSLTRWGPRGRSWR